MMLITEAIEKLFNEVHSEISKNVRAMMEELWLIWSHMGVDESSKYTNISKLVQIHKDFHLEVISETREKMKALEAQVEKLKKETEELSRCLSVEITILDFKEDMALVDYKRELEAQIAGYREQVEQRRVKRDRLLEWQRDLADKLGVTIHELKEVPLPSEEELDRLKDHLEMLQAERDKRVEIFLNNQTEIKDIMDRLYIKPQNKFEQLVVSSLSVDFKVTDINMDRLAQLRQDLQEKYEQTNNRVLELRERLVKLWDCLEEDQIYRDNFLQAHPGCNPPTENAIKEELKRCDQIKRQKIGVFVANVRTKIKLMWDNIMYSTKEREEFVHYYQDIFTEDTLTLHELYLDKITKFYNENKHIFDLVMTRKNLWLKMVELESRASEPGRYHNRGGQLLKEEKERKVIANKLPKIEAEIRDLVMHYEQTSENVFTVDGKPLLQMMQDDWESRKAERQNKLSARKQALTPSTPSFRSLATSPLGKRNRTAAGLGNTVDKNRPPVKRQLVTGSANRALASISSNLSALKRSAITTVKRRLSGRLAARVVAEGKAENAKRKLNYGEEGKKTPKITVQASILKHKRKSASRRRSGRRSCSMNGTRSTASVERQPDPLMENTLLTTYTDFEVGINERQVSRSSMACHMKELPVIKCDNYDADKPQNTPRKPPRTPAPLTPKRGKENIQHNLQATPKNGFNTPSRLTRSALKLNNDGFATPRAPLSATKLYVQKQNTGTDLLKTTPNRISRSNSHNQILRVKNLPPLI
ncbi:protein regulator of cytokinesis 1-like [Leptidea sinapis]|uniref:protein regulator of cytokinesis 1-like n=1 Tax=Leptidea sinapis TaxID=189913 RepID=UPI002129BB51|nr:protein regulator of cytokinesis 1-like [Leptidea sinapis]